MKRFFASLVLVFACGSLAGAQESPAFDQQPLDGGPHPVRPGATLEAPVAADQEYFTPVLTPSTVTPEMWMYSQERRRQEDPAQSIRSKAEFRAAQRMQRISAMKWYGMSSARPQASTMPTMTGSYSPAWVGNGADRYDWVGDGWPVTTKRIERTTTVR